MATKQDIVSIAGELDEHRDKLEELEKHVDEIRTVHIPISNGLNDASRNTIKIHERKLDELVGLINELRFGKVPNINEACEHLANRINEIERNDGNLQRFLDDINDRLKKLEGKTDDGTVKIGTISYQEIYDIITQRTDKIIESIHNRIIALEKITSKTGTEDETEDGIVNILNEVDERITNLESELLSEISPKYLNYEDGKPYPRYDYEVDIGSTGNPTIIVQLKDRLFLDYLAHTEESKSRLKKDISTAVAKVTAGYFER